MPIKLDTFKKPDPKVTTEQESSRVDPSSNYVYKDISLDLEFSGNQGNTPVNKVDDTTDLKDIRDLKAVKKSLENLFNTAPGQRLTNPFFGINLTKFLFDPVTNITANLIGRTITQGILKNEPRVKLDNLVINGYPDEAEYRIAFTISIIDSSLQGVTMNGSLNSDNFMFQEEI